MTRVLVVDDEPQLLRALRINLAARHYEVAVAADGASALRQAADWHPDVIILDLGLPDLDGVEVIHGLRGWTSIPIIVLSGRADSVDKVDALDAGADDYVTKPFGIDELLARVRVATRHTSARTPGPATVRIGEHVIDLIGKTITTSPGPGTGGTSETGTPSRGGSTERTDTTKGTGGIDSTDRTSTTGGTGSALGSADSSGSTDGTDEPGVAGATGGVRLTPTEWRMLELLLRNPGKLISQRQMLTEVWGTEFVRETNYLRQYMAQLRKKLEPDPAHPRHLITEPGMGYRFNP